VFLYYLTCNNWTLMMHKVVVKCLNKIYIYMIQINLAYVMLPWYLVGNLMHIM